MADKHVEAFAQYLAGITDEAERARVLKKAQLLAVDAAPEEAFEPPIRTLGQYLEDPIEVPPTLVDPYIVVRGGITATIGRAGKGKTVMNLNRILKWGCGRPLFDGWKDSEGVPHLGPHEGNPLKVLVIENEGAGGLFHRQIGIMLHAEGFLNDHDRKTIKENVLIWGDGGYSNLKLDDPAKLNEVRRGCEKWEPDVVFIEPFRGLWHGEENSATDMTVVIDNLANIGADYNCGVMLAHHMRKGSGEGGDDPMSLARGSTVLEGAVTVMENFEGVKGGDQRELSWSKSRHGKAPNPVRMEWVPDAWWYRWVPTSEIDDQIIEALRDNADEPMSVSDLSEALDEKAAKLRPRLKVLKDEKRVRQLPSIPTAHGTSGHRYVVMSDENQDFGGLSL